jgi:predicted ferric reductase
MNKNGDLSPELARRVRKKYSLTTAISWLSIHLVLSSGLLLLAWVGERPLHRGLLVETGVALGFLGLALMGLQALFGGRFRWVAPSFGMDNILQYHREIGLVATAFVLAHPIVLITADTSYLAFYDPRVNAMRAIALVFVTLAVPAITLTSLFRVRFGLSYEHWRLLHGLLGMAIVFIGIVHSLQVGHYMAPLWKKILLAGSMGVCLYLVVHSRLVRPWRGRGLPYRITRVAPERGQAWTLHLEPEEGRPMRFIPGQFLWITIGPSPFALQQHPFSITASARSRELTLTAKELGDHTSSWKNIPTGTPAFVEGPYGSFTPLAGHHLFLIMGGIGITPAMSILRTMRDDGDPRQAVLLYANQDADEITFKEELDELAGTLRLTVVHVLETRATGDPGITGRIDADLIAKHLPSDHSHWAFLICGPGPLMDVAETALRNLGVDWRNIYTERFEVV